MDQFVTARDVYGGRLTLQGDQRRGWSVEAISPDNYLITIFSYKDREVITPSNANEMILLDILGLEMVNPDHPSIAP